MFDYTLEENLVPIRKVGLRPSIQKEGDSSSDAQHGNGHYLTDLAPDKAKLFSPLQVSKSLFSLPREWGKLQEIAYIAFNLDEPPVKRLRNLFDGDVQAKHTNLGLWLHPSKAILSAKYIVESGLIRFKATPRENQ